MRVQVNKDLCLGCGACRAIAPAVFDLGEDGLAEAIVNEVPEEYIEDVNEAIDGCPTSAISEAEANEEMDELEEAA